MSQPLSTYGFKYITFRDLGEIFIRLCVVSSLIYINPFSSSAESVKTIASSYHPLTPMTPLMNPVQELTMQVLPKFVYLIYNEYEMYSLRFFIISCRYIKVQFPSKSIYV